MYAQKPHNQRFCYSSDLPMTRFFQKLRKVCSVGLSVFVLTACHALPSRQPEQLDFATPAKWLNASLEPPKEVNQWLESFGDPKLGELIRQGLKDNYDLKGARARINASKELAVIIGSSRSPQVFFTPGFQRERDMSSGEGGHFSALFNMNWELDIWGRIKAGQVAAENDADAVAADYHAGQLSLAARIAQVYFEWREAKLQAKVAGQSVKDRTVIVELVRGRFNKGLTRGLDLRLALTDLANAQALSAQTQNNVQILQKLLLSLLGRYPSDLSLQTDDDSYLLPHPPAALNAGLPAELLTRRPDLVSAFRRLQAADYRLSSSEKNLLPRLTLTANGGTSSAALTDIIDPRAAAWNLAAGLVQPLFTGDRLQADIRLKQANVEEAYQNYQRVALNAFRDVEQSLAAETRLREQEEALREAVAQTEASRKLAVYSYQQGLIEILTLLDSYRSTLNAQSAHLAVQKELLTNRINLYLALGGPI